LSDSALARRSKILAGAALGLLGYKASLFVPMVGICFVAGEWTIVTAAVAVAAAQTLIVVPIMGWTIAERAVLNLLSSARHADSLVMYPYLMFSWRTFWASLLVPTVARAMYVLSAVITVLFTAWRWRASGNPHHRIGILSIATVLASPHLFLYDLVVLIPAFVASIQALFASRRKGLYAATWCAYLTAFAAPLAAVTKVQFGTLALGVWLIVLGFERYETEARNTFTKICE
jgi:hypothetical protein